MNNCAKGFTDQSDCDMCYVCITSGANDCVKGFTEQSDCDMCSMCLH